MDDFKYLGVFFKCNGSVEECRFSRHGDFILVCYGKERAGQILSEHDRKVQAKLLVVTKRIGSQIQVASCSKECVSTLPNANV